MTHIKKKTTTGKIRKACATLTELLLCDDLQDTFDTAAIAMMVAAKRSLASELSERGEPTA